eukprot:sb/3477484/
MERELSNFSLTLQHDSSQPDEKRIIARVLHMVGGEIRRYGIIPQIRGSSHFDLNVLFPMSPRTCKLVKKWLSYGQKRGIARTFSQEMGQPLPLTDTINKIKTTPSKN